MPDGAGDAPTITTLNELVEAVQAWFGYDKLETSPFPSGEPPAEAALRWYRDRLALEVVGPNRFEMTCPGCQSRIAFAADDLYTCEMFDYVYWRFCPDCSTVVTGQSAAGA